MKTIYPIVSKAVFALLVITAFSISTNNTYAQCNTTIGGNGVSLFATNPITIDGNMSDWAYYLNDSDNISNDNIIDQDAPISDAGRDIKRLALTANNSNLYFFFERIGSVNNSVDFILYVDIDNDDMMELNEPVFQFSWSGSNGNVQVSVHNYIPSVIASQNILSQNMDGHTLGGTLASRSILGQWGNGSSDGKSMEVYIPFAQITQLNNSNNIISQLQNGQSFKFHFSSINGNISSIPNLNSINDNFGGCLIVPSSSSTLPLSLLNFGAILKSEKVNLNWTTTEHYNFSHFVVQRSTDGKYFKDVMTLLTDATVSSSINNYGYNDNISSVNSNVVYYRLQMVDVDGSFEYSPIRMVRLNAENKITIQAFPNPVTNELRVLIPANWQEKTITYEIYSSNGALVSRTQVARAAQVQQLNVQSLGSGNYIIRVTNGQEISSSKITKY
jgi:Secretion system C-terminal sorting domain